jgi:hypothetical protein
MPSWSAETNSPTELFANALVRVVQVLRPPSDEALRTFTTRLKVLKAEGLPGTLAGREGSLAFQANDRLRVAASWRGQDYVVGRDRQELWVHVPGKKFGLVGSPDVPLFATNPGRKDTTSLGPLKLPVAPEQMMMLPFAMKLEGLPDEPVEGVACHVFTATATPEAVRGFNLWPGTFKFWVRATDSLPLRAAYHEGNSLDVDLELVDPRLEQAWPPEKWKLPRRAGDTVETVARTHLTRFLSGAINPTNEQLPALGPATGERRVLAREGQGRLESRDGTRVLFLKGTPEDMGRQQGKLLAKEVAALINDILYGVGVGSSFEKGRWFFGEIESAQRQLAPHMDPRYLREMDALAAAAGLPPEEVRLANFFPELFHCSGFALFGKATEGGVMYHGRVLDYLRGLGLEQNALVTVYQPDQGNAWVNVGYAGFIGSVTAMNEKHLAIGEMGGRGEGHWDGKPMAQLVREVMEKAGTLDEAVDIMRKGPRTCEYYYVISDAKSKRAVGIAATPEKFETILPGQSHPLLRHAVADAVLLSAGDRYEELVRRVQAGYGKFNAERARDLMKRPVCMASNIHCALFEPGSLDFWVANADAVSPAAHTRYTHYNLGELLQPEKVAGAGSGGGSR